MEINKPDDIGDIAHLGLNLGEAKLLLAALQQEIVAAQVMVHAVRRPECRCGGGLCHVKDYRGHAIATLFGQVTVRLPRFRCLARHRAGTRRYDDRAVDVVSIVRPSPANEATGADI